MSRLSTSRRSVIVYGIVAAFAVVVTAGVVWKEFFHYRVFPKRFGVVEAGQIFRSGQLHPALVRETLAEHDVEVVVDLQYWEDKPGHLAERDAVRALGIEQYRYPLNGDGTGDIEHYALAIRKIHEAVRSGKPVLVHCAAGTQRTGGVIAAYRTLVQGMPVDAAIDELETYEWDPEDDAVLLEYLDEHMAELARRLVALGVIEAVPEPLPKFKK